MEVRSRRASSGRFVTDPWGQLAFVCDTQDGTNRVLPESGILPEEAQNVIPACSCAIPQLQNGPDFAEGDKTGQSDTRDFGTRPRGGCLPRRTAHDVSVPFCVVGTCLFFDAESPWRAPRTTNPGRTPNLGLDGARRFATRSNFVSPRTLRRWKSLRIFLTTDP